MLNSLASAMVEANLQVGDFSLPGRWLADLKLLAFSWRA